VKPDRCRPGGWTTRADRGRPGGRTTRADRGSAVVELVVLGVPLLAPLVYLAVALSSAQQARAGVTEAARQAGRAYVTGTAAAAPARAGAAARATLADRGVPAGGIEIRYVAAGSGCADATRGPWPLRPGAVFAVCVTAAVDLPAVPGGPRRLTGRFLVRADEHRDYG
jgi:Flp pilus assembly protein TadG